MCGCVLCLYTIQDDDIMLQTEFSNDGTLVSEAEVDSKSEMSTVSQGQTKRGYYIDELLSALQKDIRRGNEYEAVFWTVELESFNPRMLWNRLRVIASEDIGPAYPRMPLLIETLERHYFDARKRRNDSYRVFLSNAVVNLVRCKKSRIADNLLTVVYGEIQHEDKKLPIPDYAKDKHTREGRKMGRGWVHFFNEGCKLENEAFDDPYRERALELVTKHGGLQSEFRQKK